MTAYRRVRILLHPQPLTWLDAYHNPPFQQALLQVLPTGSSIVVVSPDQQPNFNLSDWLIDDINVVDARLFPESFEAAAQIIWKTSSTIIPLDGRDNTIVTDGWGGPVRSLLTHPRIPRVIRQAYHSLKDHNLPLYENCLISNTMHEVTPWVERPNDLPSPVWPKLEPEHHAKLRSVNLLGWGSHQNAVLKNVHEGPDFHNRKIIDVTFVGSVAHYPTWAVRRHRSYCIEAIGKLTPEIVRCVGAFMNLPSSRGHTRYDGVPIAGAIEHTRLLRMSKIAVLPWGFSENSFRDWEANAAGCHLICPDHGPGVDLVQNPYIYQKSYTCSPDFSDLPEVVDGILSAYHYHDNGYDLLQDHREEFMSRVLDFTYPARLFLSAIGDLL